MSHAIRIRMSGENAPNDALDRIETIKDTFRPILGPDSDDPSNQEVTWSKVSGPELSQEHYYSVLRFDERDDVEAIIDELHESQFPSVEWYVVHTHSCTHEFAYDEYSNNDDYPDGDVGPCDGWVRVRERGDVPDEFL